MLTLLAPSLYDLDEEHTFGGDLMRKICSPLYQKIAIELARQIKDGIYQEGERLYARSMIAEAFDVSPETARKAVNVLVDLGIMSAYHGSGTYITSAQKATAFIKQHEASQAMKQMEQSIADSIAKQEKEWLHMKDQLRQLMNHRESAYTHNPFIPFELHLNDQADHLGKRLKEMNLWQQTTATVVGILHQGHLVLSPGPYAQVFSGDTLYYIGDEESSLKMRNFFYGDTQPK